MAPQRVWFKRLSKHTKRIGVTVLGGLALFTVLMSHFGVRTTVAAPQSFKADAFMVEASESLGITNSIGDSSTLRQSEPDCKYPPCD